MKYDDLSYSIHADIRAWLEEYGWNDFTPAIEKAVDKLIDTLLAFRSANKRLDGKED